MSRPRTSMVMNAYVLHAHRRKTVGHQPTTRVKRHMSVTCVAQQQICSGGTSKQCHEPSKPMHKEWVDLGHDNFCTLTCCISIEERPLVNNIQHGTTPHVGNMWSTTSTSMRPWSKETLKRQGPNNAQSTRQWRPCLLRNTHVLQAHTK